jgi:hypothetical protein
MTMLLFWLSNRQIRGAHFLVFAFFDNHAETLSWVNHSLYDLIKVRRGLP